MNLKLHNMLKVSLGNAQDTRKEGKQKQRAVKGKGEKNTPAQAPHQTYYQPASFILTMS